MAPRAAGARVAPSTMATMDAPLPDQTLAGFTQARSGDTQTHSSLPTASQQADGQRCLPWGKRGDARLPLVSRDRGRRTEKAQLPPKAGWWATPQGSCFPWGLLTWTGWWKRVRAVGTVSGNKSFANTTPLPALERGQTRRPGLLPPSWNPRDTQVPQQRPRYSLTGRKTPPV